MNRPKKTKETQMIGIRLTPAMRRELERAAAHLDTDVSKFTRNAIREKLATVSR